MPFRQTAILTASSLPPEEITPRWSPCVGHACAVVSDVERRAVGVDAGDDDGAAGVVAVG